MRFGRKKSLKDRAQDYVEQLSDTVLPQLEHAWEQAVDKAGPAIADARDKAAPILADARDKATETAHVGAAVAAAKATEAREKAGPVLAAKATEARDKAAPLLAEARATAADKASVGASLAAEKAAASREIAAAKVNELRGVEPEPKGGKLKKVLLLGGLLALGGFIFSKLKGKQDDGANWQSTYVPPAPPKPASPAAPATPASPAAPASGATPDPLTDPLPEAPTADDVVTQDPPASDDIGGGAPGEAISDSVEEAHPATTPDDPAEVIDVDDVPKKD